VWVAGRSSLVAGRWLLVVSVGATSSVRPRGRGGHKGRRYNIRTAAWTHPGIRGRRARVMRALALSVLLGLIVAPSARAVSGRNGRIAAEHRLAAEAGLRVLQRGGNAVDAAVATALAVGVVNPSSCGIGGGGFMLVFERAQRRVYALDYRETAPAAA